VVFLLHPDDGTGLNRENRRGLHECETINDIDGVGRPALRVFDESDLGANGLIRECTIRVFNQVDVLEFRCGISAKSAKNRYQAAED